VRNFNTHPLTEESSTVEDPSDITALKARLERAAPRRSPAAASDEELLRRLSDVVSASGPERGKALERLVVDLFMTLDGLQILRCNARLLAEELDIVLKNDLTNGFWRIAGSPIIVECKNWSGKVGAREISVMVDKMRSISPDVKTGILVAMNGISGDAHRDAMLKVREARQRGQYILVLERSDIEEACSGISLAQLLERKYEALVLL
jgi:Holliday junction resolvase-like predicted endonuclease